jgi:IS1 family transposase
VKAKAASARTQAATVREPAVPRRVSGLKLDKFWSFVGAKRHLRWTWLAFDRQRSRIAAFVNGRQADRSCRRLLVKLEGCRVTRRHGDDSQSYRTLPPPAVTCR